MEEIDFDTGEVLEEILGETRACFMEWADYIKDETAEEYGEVREYYASAVSFIDSLLSELDSGDATLWDLVAGLDTDSLTDLVEYISAYAENFTVSCHEPRQEEDLREAEKIDFILGLFFDDSEDEADEDDGTF